MSSSKFRISRLLLYFVLVSLFLFVSGNVGRYLIETQDMDRQIAMLLQGVIFTGLTLVLLFVLKRTSPNIFINIGVKGVNSLSKLIVGIALPFTLLLSGILTAYLFGGIENVSLNLTASVIISILINSVTAFMYEAFPEEIFIRGLIFEELHKKYRFITSLVLQSFIFICVPITVMSLESIFFSEPFALTIDYFILLFTFGIALQLYKKYTGTIWMSIIFHIVYLEVARYISMGGVYEPDVAILKFDEMFGGFMTLYLSFLFIVVFSIVALSVLLIIDKRKNKSENKER
ncbi:type II CAAX endopeptidase family protein [Virgibacillus salexigens]|uniref:type II CAAX endopeptidase family protein n=1 Tax=Virgibacillus massiliensis TaxID=1462526 RepID=UPI0013707C19|nr:type II CAAX endopeptidase family protein [Virgibacillus massiliensis]MYL43642.1 CPBP family intramembrane metalloprotease [Virgibacillus massiliensis]